MNLEIYNSFSKTQKFVFVFGMDGLQKGGLSTFFFSVWINANEINFVLFFLILKAPERRYCRSSGVVIVNFEHISHLVLVFLLLTLSR